MGYSVLKKDRRLSILRGCLTVLEHGQTQEEFRADCIFAF